MSQCTTSEGKSRREGEGRTGEKRHTPPALQEERRNEGRVRSDRCECDFLHDGPVMGKDGQGGIFFPPSLSLLS